MDKIKRIPVLLFAGVQDSPDAFATAHAGSQKPSSANPAMALPNEPIC